MVVGEVAAATEILVVGGGPGGYAAALRCAQRGKQVTLVERARIGGTCLNVGCIPSKVLLHLADVLAAAVGARDAGLEVEARIDMERVQAHMLEVVTGLTDGVSELLRHAGVTVVPGDAHFSTENRVAVAHEDAVRHFEFDEAIVATGSRPIELAGLPFDGARVLDSTGALALRSVPQRMAIVGGGYIGVELATAFAKLGSEVSLVEALPRLLPQMPRRIAPVLQRGLEGLGVRVLVGHQARHLGGGGLEIEDAQGEALSIPADVVVVAVGRRPNTDDLGLALTGAKRDDHGLIVVAPSRRAARRVLAIGDVTAGPALAHKATAEAEVAAATACGELAVFDPASVPQVVFSDPEVVSVGLDESEARDAGYEARSFRFPMAAVSRARTLSRRDGFAELVADGDGTVIGAHLVGYGVSELAGEATLAIEMAATIEDLRATIHAHPTLSESLLEAAHGLAGHALHVAGLRAGK